MGRKGSNEFHSCEFYYGKIGDVTVRHEDLSIHCRRCGVALLDSQVLPSMLAKINTAYKEKIK